MMLAAERIKSTKNNTGQLMYHIAICDDDEKFIKYMERLCRQANGGRDEELKFYEYHSGEELVWELESMPQILDMLILDMQFGKGKMDGDAAAAKFREMFPDAVLIFCSGVCLPTVRSFYSISTWRMDSSMLC